MVPLGSAIWSANPTTFTNFPARALFQFLDNHGLLAVRGRPTWRSVVGGSSTYVGRLIPHLTSPPRLSTPIVKIERNDTGIEVIDVNGHVEHCDHVVLACHTDQALSLLAHPTAGEQSVLSSFRYQPNVVTLHTDRKMLPKSRRAWASWNYHVPINTQTLPTVTYYMNTLQRLESNTDIMVTLNRQDEIDGTQILRQFEMAHPVYDQKAVSAQQRLHEIQGVQRVWFASAGWGHGFHEDGMRSAVSVASGLGVQW
jgi:predicted NAD/FAD-binding protein